MLFQDLRDPFQLLPGERTAGRVVRVIEDQQLRLRIDQPIQILKIKGKVLCLVEMDRHGLRAARDDLRFVDREARVRVDHLVAGAMVGGGEDGVGDEGLRAGAHHHVLRADRQPAAHARHVPGRRLAQRVDARRGRVAVLALADRADARLLHVQRRREVRLADAEADDVLALRGERGDFGQHDEGVLGAEGLGAFAEGGHGGSGGENRVF